MKKELETMKKLSHPNIMRVFEILQNKTDIYLVTEFIKGEELYKRLENNNKFSEQRVAFIIN